MSLKVFHIVFILLSILLAVGCAAWSFMGETALGFGILSAMTAAGLMVYGVWFIKKSKKIIT